VAIAWIDPIAAKGLAERDRAAEMNATIKRKDAE
jgi:hypothetical protein